MRECFLLNDEVIWLVSECLPIKNEAHGINDERVSLVADPLRFNVDRTRRAGDPSLAMAEPAECPTHPKSQPVSG